MEKFLDLLVVILLSFMFNHILELSDKLKLSDAEVQNQKLVISEYQRYYEACLSNLNDMEKSCHK